MKDKIILLKYYSWQTKKHHGAKMEQEEQKWEERKIREKERCKLWRVKGEYKEHNISSERIIYGHMLSLGMSADFPLRSTDMGGSTQ